MLAESLEGILILIIILGFLGAFLDGSLGMGYGLLSPILIALGLDPLVVVPMLLLSQMTTGLSVTIFHVLFKNFNLSSNDKQDLKSTILFVITGLIGMTVAIFIATHLSKEFVMLYIGIIIIIAGILMLPKKQFDFSWKRMYILSGIGSFNKAISGGGYGPVMTIGQITSGREAKESVAVTDLSEAILSGYGFFLYILLENFSERVLLTIELGLIMIISGLIATPLGALFTKKLDKKVAKKIIGLLSISIGIFTIVRFGLII
ncbi:MAG: TSUP family transporter [Promethearchaeati archaeon]